jgi:hypothetical protein
MKPSVFPLILLLALVMPAMAQQPAEPAMPIVGGYQTAKPDDKDIKAAADFALSAAPKRFELKEIVSARQQVVAGMNYSLCLRVKAPKFGLFARGHLVAAKVFRDLDARYQLTSWQDVKTCD